MLVPFRPNTPTGTVFTIIRNTNSANIADCYHFAADLTLNCHHEFGSQLRPITTYVVYQTPQMIHHWHGPYGVFMLLQTNHPTIPSAFTECKWFSHVLAKNSLRTSFLFFFCDEHSNRRSVLFSVVMFFCTYCRTGYIFFVRKDTMRANILPKCFPVDSHLDDSTL